MPRVFRIILIASACLPILLVSPSVLGADRVTNGLEALYDFSDDNGDQVKDRSGQGKPVDLRISNTKAVKRSKGTLEVRGKTLIQTQGSPNRIMDALRKSGEITVEAWLHPANTKQDGPARIVTISKNTSERNFTLGQEGDAYDVRLRTTKTSTNGIPSISAGSKSVATKLTHLVYTRNRNGQSRIYIDGKQRIEKSVPGDLSNWDKSHRLVIGNELTQDRPWLGTFFLVAIYSRNLSAMEVEQNFKAGAGAVSPELVRNEPPSKAVAAQHFEKRVAPLLAQRCLSCHGWKSTKGRLDLSQKRTALAGGKNGKAIVPGDASASLLWESIKTDEMPEKGPPLTGKEKSLLRDWINDGAVWSRDSIDKAVFIPDRRDDANWLRRLTVLEYIETVRASVGVDIEKEARQLLPRDLRADGFSNTAYNLNVDLAHVEAYAKLAELTVSRLNVAKFAGPFGNKRDTSAGTMRNLIANMGKWLLRGPLNDQEIASFAAVSEAVIKEGGDFDEATGYIIEAMLQSPRFIYRMENQVAIKAESARPVSSYELASRMSYILWGASPDKALMQAAESGGLSTRTGVESQIKRMLADSRTITRSSQFIYEWLDLGRMDHLRPNAKHFPKWNAQLASDMRAETLAFYNEVVWQQKRPMSDLFNAQFTFATPRLAEHYGLSPKGTTLAKYDLSNVGNRGGLLTQGSVLTIGGDEASMVTRGLFVLHHVLRGHVDDPPPGLDTTPVPSSPGQSQRVIAEGRIKNQSCGGCHSKFEPLSFGLEMYDGIGAFHKKDHHGNTLREDGEILFPGASKPISYKSSSEMMSLLAGSDRVKETITWKVTQWAICRPLVDADKPTLDKIHKAAQDGGGTYPSLITAIVMSELVQTTRTEPTP